MNSRLYYFAAMVILFSSVSYIAVAQTAAEALQYSQLQPQGTARSMGFGGALGSIGGDFGSLSVNPAGLGIYRSSELMFTPALRINGVQSEYMGTNTADNNTRFTFNNFGVVLTNALSGRRYERSSWKSYSFGFGINRLADFNRNYTYTGFNNTSSGAEQFSIDANLYPDDVQNVNQLAGLGYQSFLLDYDSASGLYIPVVPYSSGINQTRSVEERGGISEFNISFGANYEERLMVGITVGLPSVKYLKDATYTETDASNNNDNDFASFNYTESLSTKGSGINAKLGFIYKVNDVFRFGAAFHTPTYYMTLHDIYNRSVTSNTENFKSYLGYNTGPVTQVNADEQQYEYGLTTPGRFVLSASGIFNKSGFVTADFEVVNYPGARYNFDPQNAVYQNELNQRIKNVYKTAFNARLGAEKRFDNLLARLGVGYYGSPFQDASFNGDRLDLSAGIGFRFDNWFTDLAFVHTLTTQQQYPYVLNYALPVGTIAPIATLNNSLNNIALTFGFKF